MWPCGSYGSCAVATPSQEKKLTEEELKNQLKYRTVLAVKNNKYEDVCAWWLVLVLLCSVQGADVLMMLRWRCCWMRAWT